MKRNLMLMILAVAAMAFGSAPAFAQVQTTFTGTALIYGSGRNTRTVTAPFTLRLTGQTTAAETAKYLSVLEDKGQDKLLDTIRNNELGRFSIDNGLGLPLNAVVVDDLEGKTRIRAVFARWMNFGELRGGYRSVDYPFGYVEIIIDPDTGKGDGTFIPAARIRFKHGKNGMADTVEIEDFGVFPGRLLGVTRRGGMR